ncbi:hypothetical protein K8Q93_03370 [Candidatus Parcubacteria bacterium]|nr:hypothetical protein [Candidatus Parcubacteria bacterium]
MKFGTIISVPGLEHSFTLFQNYDDRRDKSRFDTKNVEFLRGVQGNEVPQLVHSTHSSRCYLGFPALRGILQSQEGKKRVCLPEEWKAYYRIVFCGSTFYYRLPGREYDDYAYLALRQRPQGWELDFLDLESRKWLGLYPVHPGDLEGKETVLAYIEMNRRS